MTTEVINVPYPEIKDTLHYTLKNNQFERLLKFCQTNKVLFVDKTFPPNKVALFKDQRRQGYDGKMNDIVFSRPNAIYPNEKFFLIGDVVDPCDIVQGQLGHCYFLSSLASLSEQQTLITRLFYTKEFNENGVLGVWLFINGFWKLVPLDEYFPTRKDRSGKTALTFSSNGEKEFWVAALEKAYAKVYGSYFDIVGGDPVFSLRDLTGAPFERIVEFKDMKDIWRKLIDGVAKNFVMAACSKPVDGQVEGNLGMGVVGGHAYSILDARNIVDSSNRPRMILQLRNPWGSHEWSGEFSDNSPLWTAKLKADLDVVKRDDGLFWMPFEKFTNYFDAIAILKIRPGYINNSLLVKRDSRTNSAIIRVVVHDAKANVTFSVDQNDSRVYDDPDYYYCYFRLTVGRVLNDETIEFVHHQATADRSIFFESNLLKGNYIVLINCFWNSDKQKDYAVGTYSDAMVDLELLPADAQLIKATEKLLWVDFATKNKSRFKNTQSKTHKYNNLTATVEYSLYEDPESLTKVHAYRNTSSTVSVHQSHILKVNNYDIIADIMTQGKAEIMMNPGEIDVLVMSARMFAGLSFSSMQYVSSVELSSQKFPNDARTVPMLCSLGSTHPTPDDPDPEMRSREMIAKQNADHKGLDPEGEAARQCAKEAYFRTQQQLLQEYKAFTKNQTDDFYNVAQNDPSLQKYIDPSTSKVDPRMVISESFKDINIPRNDNDTNSQIYKVKLKDFENGVNGKPGKQKGQNGDNCNVF